MQLHKDQKGFSLVEMLVAVAIGAIIMSMIMVLLSSGLRNFRKQSNSINLQNEMQEASNVIEDALMEAIIINKYSQGDWTFLQLDYVKDDDTFASKNTCKVLAYNRKTTTLYAFDTAGWRLFKANKTESYKAYAYSGYVSIFSVDTPVETKKNSLKYMIDVTIGVSSNITDELITDTLHIVTRNSLNEAYCDSYGSMLKAE